MLFGFLKKTEETEEDTSEKQTTTEFAGVLQYEQAQARKIEAKDEFEGRLKRHEKTHLVSQAAMDQWYKLNHSIKRNRNAIIVDEFGQPESIWITK